MTHSVMTASEKTAVKFEQDRRSFSRIPACFGIKFTIFSTPESMTPAMKSIYSEGQICNLSACGLMLQTVEPVESEELVALNFSLPSLNRRVRSLAEVVHVSLQGRKYHAGIRFLKLGLNDAINIMQYVSEYCQKESLAA